MQYRVSFPVRVHAPMGKTKEVEIDLFIEAEGEEAAAMRVETHLQKLIAPGALVPSTVTAQR